MKKNRHKGLKPRYIFAGIIVICLIFITLSLNNKGGKLPIQNVIESLMMPMEKGLNSIGSLIHDKCEKRRSADELREENAQLKEEINQLNTRISSMENNLAELDSLRELLKMKEVYPDYEMVGARVISKDPGNWFNSFIIDKGSQDGIKKNMNVIYDNGLVGIVTDVSKNNAVVRSIIDDKSSVSGMLTKTNDLCIVNGDLQLYQQGLLNVEMISKEAKIVAGDEIVTSYISDKYLPGLVIGYISDIHLDNGKVSQNGHITPKVNFDNLTNVMIITQLKADLIMPDQAEEANK